MRIDFKVNNHTLQLKKLDDKDAYRKNTKRQVARSFQEDEKPIPIIVRKKRFIP